MANAKVVLDSNGIRKFLKKDDLVEAVMKAATDLLIDIESADSSGAAWEMEEHVRPSRSTVVIVPRGRDDEEAEKAKWTEMATGDIAKAVKRAQRAKKRFRRGA